MERKTLFGTDRSVLYLEEPTETIADIDGSRSQGIRSATEKFLSSPPTAFDKQIDSHLHQVRHLKSNTRAFAVWCQDQENDRELCVVLVVYRKRNERHFFNRKARFNDEGREWYDRFAGLSSDDYQAFLARRRSDADLLFVEN